MFNLILPVAGKKSVGLGQGILGSYKSARLKCQQSGQDLIKCDKCHVVKI